MKNVIKLFCIIVIISIIFGCEDTADTKICAYCEGTISWHQHDYTVYREIREGKDGKPYHPWCYKIGVLPNE
jgi:hypothetical protein